MPQPTINSWPFAVKEFPSADGHTGAAVAGVGAAEVETVAGKLADAGAFDAGVINEVSVELDSDGLPLIGPRVLVPGGTI